MKRFRLLGVALLAFMALGVVGASVAAAENPEILPTPTTAAPLKFTSVSDEGSAPVLQATKEAGKIKCKDLTNKGEFTSARLGKITIDFLGECESNKAKCKTEGDTTGTILVSGDIHLVDIEKGTELRLGVVVTLEKALVITCGVVKDEVKGAVIGLVLEVTSLVKTKHITADFNQTAGEQELKECKLDKAFCEGKKFLLESNFGEGFELSGQEVKDLITFEKEAEVHF
jgi:hypothetical protein